MKNPRYDPSNYFKHPVIPVLSGNQKINTLFRSYLLLVKWSYIDTRKLVDTSARIRVSTSTPLGDLEPKDYNLKIFSNKNIYLQFIEIPNGDLDSKLEVFQSSELKSLLEIWEYNQPFSYLNPLSITMPTYPLDGGSDPAIITALQAQTAAQLATTAAVNALPTKISSATNNPVTTSLSNTLALTATAVSQVVAKGDNTKGIQILNTGNVNVKFWISDILVPVATPYTDASFDMELKPNTVWEVPVGLVNSGIYALSKISAGALSVTVSYREFDRLKDY